MTEQLTLTYLGVAGWYLKGGDASLLIDPFFTRPGLWRFAFTRLRPDHRQIAAHTPTADAILVTHPHYDHIMDVPAIAQHTGAAVYASEQSCRILTASGVPTDQQKPLSGGETLQVGPFTVEAYVTPHRTILGRIPAEGPIPENWHPPAHAARYRILKQFSFRITAHDLRVLVTSGIDGEPEVPADVLLVGADMPDERLIPLLDAARPALVMPNHWDDMFRSLDETVRPSIKPTCRFSVPRRLDLAAWQQRVRALAPTARVMVPEHLTPYPLHDLTATQ